MSWRIRGSYFESCNCDAICPCRSVGGQRGGRSTHGICQFALSWHLGEGNARDVPLDGFDVVMAGGYDDDEQNSPWRVVLYVDERATAAQQRAIADIFLGRAGGTTLTNFAAAIGEVHHVRKARIALSHIRRRWAIRAGNYVDVSATTPVESTAPVVCGIPGLDRPGEEVVAEVLRVTDEPLAWELHEPLRVRDHVLLQLGGVSKPPSSGAAPAPSPAVRLDRPSWCSTGNASPYSRCC